MSINASFAVVSSSASAIVADYLEMHYATEAAAETTLAGNTELYVRALDAQISLMQRAERAFKREGLSSIEGFARYGNFALKIIEDRRSYRKMKAQQRAAAAEAAAERAYLIKTGQLA